MDLSLTNDLDDSFLNDWGDEENKEEEEEESPSTERNRDVSIGNKKAVNEKPMSHSQNLHPNSDQNNNPQYSSYLSPLMDGGNNLNLSQNQELSTQPLPPFWSNHMAWSQQAAVSKQNHLSNNQKQGNETSSNEKNVALHQNQSNAASNVAQHQSQHVIQQSQPDDNTLHRAVWQSAEMKSSQHQTQQSVPQRQQAQSNQIAIHPMYPHGLSNADRNTHQAELYQNVALAMMKGQQQQNQQTNTAAISKNSSGVTNSINDKQGLIVSNGKIQRMTTSSILNDVAQQQSQVQQQNNGMAQSASAAIQPQPHPPPFYLFGAPCELRYNFIQSQKQHDLPIWQDNNSYHYGMAINGFHPQLNAMENPPVLIDSRHAAGKKGSGGKSVDSAQRASSCKERNEKEQRRAQKITELIERLRLSMVEGGWKVEMKSKYHTLLTCKDYVTHLIQTTQEKEQALEKAKADLVERQQKQQEDKALSESRSDPESVMSSLTSSSRCTSSNSSSASIDDKDSKPNSENTLDRKRKQAFHEEEKNSKARRDFKGKNNVDSSSADSSEEENGGDSTPFTKQPSDPQAISTSDEKEDVSDSKMSDVHKVSESSSKSDNSDSNDSKSKVSSDKTSASEIKKKGREKIQLDYEEVFMTSNVPQLIATSAGRIIKYNHFFLKAIGLTEQELRYLTLFSIVQADQLSTLFETLGGALRGATSSVAKIESSYEPSKSMDSTDKDENSSSSSSQGTNFSVISLPCIQFPARFRPVGSSEDKRILNKFFMTISLLNDEDPQKCFFHCLLTDFSGDDKRANYISSDSSAQKNRSMRQCISLKAREE